MKKVKFIVAAFLVSAVFFVSCEKENESTNQVNSKTSKNNISHKVSFDFSIVEEVNYNKLNEIDADFIKAGKEISLAKELKKLEDEDNISDLSSVNDYLSYKGEKLIDTKEYYLRTQELIDNPDARVEDFARVLSEYNIYSTSQLEMFIELDSKMSNTPNFEEAVFVLNEFKDKVRENRELSTFEQNTLLLYVSAVKGFMYSDTNLKAKGCFSCIWKNKWRILGWGFFRSIPKIIICIFSNLGSFWAMFWCILKSLGGGIAHSFRQFCGSYC